MEFKKAETPHIYLFVDGSAHKPDDLGAWAAWAVTAQKRKLLWAVEYPTTISRCELRPIIEGLRWVKANWVRGPGTRVRVHSDSEYTVQTLQGLIPRRKNAELWVAVEEAAQDMLVEYVWHERNVLPYMSSCDMIAGTLRKASKHYATRMFRDIYKPEDRFPAYPVDD